ICVRCL
ncbi:hypothetical protein CP09DC80_0727B, partial [Chlamydia psittaci 09DC80]